MLRADKLVAIRGDRLVLRGVSFGLAAGQGLLVRGGNGTGKSTLLRILAGLRSPDGGAVFRDQEDVATDPAPHIARLSYLGHQDAIKPMLTVVENLVFSVPCPLPPGRMEAALTEAGLDHMATVPARFLSAGQKRRVALLRMIVAEKQLWLLDEPSVGLDDVAVAWLEAAIARHLAAGGIVIVATHTALIIPDAMVITL